VHLGFEEMAIAPKNPRKRAAKKTPKVKGEVSPETAPFAPVIEVATPDEKKTKPVKKAAVVPVAIFQAAPIAEKAPAKKALAKKSAPVKEAKSDEAVVESAAAGESDSDSEDSSRGRRRRRGGRGRRKPGSTNTDENSSTEENSESSETEDDGTGTHRRRRRRRAAGDGVVPGEVVEEDGVVTVVKVRETKERPTRNDPKRNRRERNDRPSSRGDREYRSDYREPYRRRGTIITDTDLLARRENVDREMLVRQIADRTQIAVIEDNVMVEHYVNRNTPIFPTSETSILVAYKTCCQVWKLPSLISAKDVTLFYMPVKLTGILLEFQNLSHEKLKQF
jgi:ribonuclease E